jgi:chromosome segregation ATPase
MKKLTLCLSLGYILFAIITVAACQTTQAKIDKAQEKANEAAKDIKALNADARADKIKTADAQEWKAFKEETEAKIKANEARIAELRIKLKKPGKILDGIYEAKIEKLERQNKDMRLKLEAYEQNQTDWQAFKTEFNHDMDELGQALKDITVDNKK